MTALAQRLHAFDYANRKRGSHIADGLARMQDLVDGPIAEILAAKDADARDAARYRFLRNDIPLTDAPRFAVPCPDNIAGCKTPHRAAVFGHQLDAAIDAALTRGEGAGDG